MKEINKKITLYFQSASPLKIVKNNTLKFRMYKTLLCFIISNFILTYDIVIIEKKNYLFSTNWYFYVEVLTIKNFTKSLWFKPGVGKMRPAGQIWL